MSNYSPDLIAALQVNGCEKVWFNSDGVWAFHEREGFNTAVPASEILGVTKPVNQSAEPDSEPKPGKKK